MWEGKILVVLEVILPHLLFNIVVLSDFVLTRMDNIKWKSFDGILERSTG